MEDIAVTIKNIIIEVLELEPDEVTMNSTLDQLLSIDSVAVLEILVSIERIYSITLSENEIRPIKDVQGLIELVKSKMK